LTHLSDTLPQLLHLRPAFRRPLFGSFLAAVHAWILCLSTRTVSELWQASDLPGQRHYSSLYHLFSRARWHWDDPGMRLLACLIRHFAPDGTVWLAVDDTLCHKRGHRVAFGGIFLDPVLSSRSRKVFRFGVNYVVLALVVKLPYRPERYFALPVLWRTFKKKGEPGHQKKTELARALVDCVAEAFAERSLCVVADAAYTNATVVRDRPANVQVIGPLPAKAALYQPPAPRQGTARGRPRKKGARLPTPRESFQDVQGDGWRDESVAWSGADKPLRVREVSGVLWYTGCGEERVSVVLVRDPSESWPDTALLCTGPSPGAAAVVSGYSRRWSIEVAFRDAKQYLGMQDAQVWCANSVERTHPMALFVVSVTVWWYDEQGRQGEAVRRERPWYKGGPAISFAGMLGALRLALWQRRINDEMGDEGGEALILEKLLHHLAAVR
jgi:DDE superfamily endonuclease